MGCPMMPLCYDMLWCYDIYYIYIVCVIMCVYMRVYLRACVCVCVFELFARICGITNDQYV
jgi:hypothetical protein